MTTPMARMSRMTGPEERGFLLFLLIMLIMIFVLAFTGRSVLDRIIYWPMNNEQKSQCYYENAMLEKSKDKQIVWLEEALILDPKNELASAALSQRKPSPHRKGRPGRNNR